MGTIMRCRYDLRLPSRSQTILYWAVSASNSLSASETERTFTRSLAPSQGPNSSMTACIVSHDFRS